jgi:SOS-response transcriptional repressor LexA
MDSMAKRLRQFREEKQISQRELSRLTGIEQGTISRIERGEMELVSPHLRKLSRILGVSEARLLGIASNITPGQIGSQRIPIRDLTQLRTPIAAEQHASTDPMDTFVLSDFSRSVRAFALHIRGDSMEPTFCEGDLVVIDPEVTLRPGDFVVGQIADGDSVFRRYRDIGVNVDGNRIFELMPLNPLYASVRSDISQLTITGVMVEHRRYRKN